MDIVLEKKLQGKYKHCRHQRSDAVFSGHSSVTLTLSHFHGVTVKGVVGVQVKSKILLLGHSEEQQR